MAPKNQPEFSSGRTVKARDLQYIQRPADAELLDHCRNGRPAYILHSPQMGKSSLIAHTAEQLNATAHHAVLIDLSQFPLPPREEEWFHKIVRILDDSLDLSMDPVTWWENQQALPPPARLTQLITEIILPEMTGPLVLFVDEIERTTNLPFREHFFEWLSTLYESRATSSLLYRVSFVVCGMATPSQLIPEGGPLLFQWSHRVVLADFTLPEALLLAEGLSLPTEAATETVRWIYRWTNGHPYLTQLLCQLLEGQHRMTWLEPEVDECIQHFITSPQGLREPNFQVVRTALTEPATNGGSLLEPYLDLLEGRTENLQTNQSALEQLRLVGVLREDDEEIAIRNHLYQKVFPPTWVKRHLRSPASITQSPAAPAVASPSSTPQSVAQPPAPRHSYVMAASLFLIGVGLLIWFFRGPVTPSLSVSSEDAHLVTKEPLPKPPDLAEVPRNPEQRVALSQAQEKIEELEATIIRYQQLSSGEVESLTDQRTQLETQLALKNQELSDLQAQVQSLEITLVDQRDTHDNAIAGLQAERTQWQTKATATVGELKTALEEVKTLQTAVLKKSSLSPSEINKLMADRSQLVTQLQTANTELALSQEQTRGLESRLAQQQQLMKTDSQRFVEDRTKLEAQIKSAESALHETREILKATEASAKEQVNLAQTELTRLQQDRSNYQEQLRAKEQAITAFETRADELTRAISDKEQVIQDTQREVATLKTRANSLTTTLSEKEQAIQDARQEVATLETRTNMLRETLAERDNASQQAQQTIRRIRSELQEVQDRKSQARDRITQLDTMLTEQRQTIDGTLFTLRKERDQLSSSLTEALADLTSTKNRMTTLTTELTSARQELTSRQGALRNIHTASSEKSRQAKNQIAALSLTSTELGSRLHRSEEAFHQAQQRIAELEKHSKKLTALTKKLETSAQEGEKISAKLTSSQSQLARAQQQILSLEAALKKKSTTLSFSPSSQPSTSLKNKTHSKGNSPKGQKELFASQILKTLSQSSSSSIPHHTQLLLARQAFLYVLQSDGRNWSSTNRVLQEHFPDSAINLKNINEKLGILTFDPNRSRLVGSTKAGTIWIWSLKNPAKGPKKFQSVPTNILSLAFSPNGRWLAAGGEDNLIRVWDTFSPNTQPKFLRGHKKAVIALTFNADNNRLVSGSKDRLIRFWNISQSTPESTILGKHSDWVNSLFFSHDKQRVISMGEDRNIKEWDLLNMGTPIRIFRFHKHGLSPLALHPSGGIIAKELRDNQIGIWNLEHPGQPPKKLTGNLGNISSLQFSPKGKYLVSISSGNSVRLWNWISFDESSILLSEGKKIVSAVAISSDNHKIAIAREGHPVIIWPSPDDLAEAICNVAKRNLSLKEWNLFIGDSLTYERTCWNFPLHASFLEEGRRLAKKDSRVEALAIFERAKFLDSTLNIIPENELAKFSPQQTK